MRKNSKYLSWMSALLLIGAVTNAQESQPDGSPVVSIPDLHLELSIRVAVRKSNAEPID